MNHQARARFSIIPRHFIPWSAMAALGLATGLVGCNVFDPLDSPTSDKQLVSAARGCFDKGDYQCALDNYGKLSGADADIKNSESAFVVLDQNGAGMGNFISAFGSGKASTGISVTRLAGFVQHTASATTRLNIFHAYQKVLLINDTSLRGLVRFVGSAALIAEMLAEDAQTPGKFQDTDLVVNPAGCKAAVAAGTCGTDITSGNPCLQPPTDKFQSGTALGTPLSSATDLQITNSGLPSFQIMNAAISEALTALSELGVSSGSSVTFVNALTNPTLISLSLVSVGSNISPCYRQALLTNDVGTN